MPDPERCPLCFEPLPQEGPCPICTGEDREEVACPSALSAGTVLNTVYQVGRVLGRHGGFGITYLGWDTKLAVKVAIKEFFPQNQVTRIEGNQVVPQVARDRAWFTEGRQRFLEEARILAHFSHPNIVRVRSYFEENNTAYLVMDYYTGRTLAQYLDEREQPLSGPDARMLLEGIMAGLARVHERGFLHRDLKPQNIYLTEDGCPVLLDFGAARMSRPEESRSRSILLTPGYAPIEQYHRHGKQGPWTDVYGLAATLYYMVTKVTPPDAVERSYEDPLKPPRDLSPNLDTQLDEAILAGLALDYRNRPASIPDFQQILEGHRPAPVIEKKWKQPVQRHRWHLAWWAVPAVLLALAAGYGIRHWVEPSRPNLPLHAPSRETIRSLLAEEARLMDRQQQRREDATYQKALGLNTEQALTEYLRKNGPKAVYYEQARSRLIRIIADDVAFQAAEERNTATAFQAYINLFGEEGSHYLEARKRLLALTSATPRRSPEPDPHK